MSRLLRRPVSLALIVLPCFLWTSQELVAGPKVPPRIRLPIPKMMPRPLLVPPPPLLVPSPPLMRRWALGSKSPIPVAPLIAPPTGSASRSYVVFYCPPGSSWQLYGRYSSSGEASALCDELSAYGWDTQVLSGSY